MAYTLGENSYGKAEIRLLHVTREDSHEVRDLTVGVELTGAFDATYLTGDNGSVLPTDSQKNAVYALAREHGVSPLEGFAHRLARHFCAQPAVASARVTVAEHPWVRTGATGHSFARSTAESRTTTVTGAGERAWVVSGLDGLQLLNTTDSEFRGYIKDAYTTLPETGDRVLATAVQADWRYSWFGALGGWDSAHARARAALIETFAGTYSRSLQQTLYAMGEAVLDVLPDVAEVRLRLPNLHHLHVDLTPFGLDNPNIVFHPDDRPYGLITGTVVREGAPPAGLAW